MADLQKISYAKSSPGCKEEETVRQILSNKDYDKFIHKEMSVVLHFHGCIKTGIGRWAKEELIMELIYHYPNICNFVCDMWLWECRMNESCPFNIFNTFDVKGGIFDY